MSMESLLVRIVNASMKLCKVPCGIRRRDVQNWNVTTLLRFDKLQVVDCGLERLLACPEGGKEG